MRISNWYTITWIGKWASDGEEYTSEKRSSEHSDLDGHVEDIEIDLASSWDTKQGIRI